MGLNPDDLPYAQGRQLLNEQFRRWNAKLCTFRQAGLLKKHGIDCREMKMKDASAIIDALAKNGWRRGPVVDGVIDGVLNPKPKESEVPF